MIAEQAGKSEEGRVEQTEQTLQWGQQRGASAKGAAALGSDPWQAGQKGMSLPLFCQAP